jgi:hypothetical protein
MVTFLQQARPQANTFIDQTPLRQGIQSIATGLENRRTSQGLAEVGDLARSGASNEAIANALLGSSSRKLQAAGINQLLRARTEAAAAKAREAAATESARRFDVTSGLQGRRVAVAEQAETREQAEADAATARRQSVLDLFSKPNSTGQGTGIDTTQLTSGERIALDIALGKDDAKTIKKIMDAVQARAKRGKQKAVSANVVVEDIERGIGIIKRKPNLTTGIGGQILSNIGGTDAANLANLLTTVEANAGFDRLQQMREASPTGGALGQVSNLELGQLNAAIGALKQSQSDDQLIDNMLRVKNIYLDIIHGEGQGPPRELPSFQQTDTPTRIKVDANGNLIQ